MRLCFAHFQFFDRGKAMQRGVVYGMLAGALWGMVFLVPRLLPDFSPVLLSAGRYASL